ncbi:unnamed protein product [Pedinophyceae sp. YPF-701]|nr:unnamed protein product [Pedinophyceae sp. YPF-701]
MKRAALAPHDVNVANVPDKADQSAKGALWRTDLTEYVQQGRGASGHAERQQLAAAIEASPASAEAWLAFLTREEECARVSGSGPALKRGRVPLKRLYDRCTQVVPLAGNRASDAYLALWLGLARQQSAHGLVEDARETYKSLKNNMIGTNQAVLFQEWAAFEAACGRHRKATDILRKGIDANAKPSAPLHDLLRSFERNSAIGDEPAVPRGAATPAPGRSHAEEAPSMAPEHTLRTPAPRAAAVGSLPTRTPIGSQAPAPVARRAPATARRPATLATPAHADALNGATPGVCGTASAHTMASVASSRSSESVSQATSATGHIPTSSAPVPRCSDAGHAGDDGGNDMEIDETGRIVDRDAAKAAPRPARPVQQRPADPSVLVNGVKYKVLECVGKGGSSKVYKVIGPDNRIYALKRIKLDGRDPEASRGFLDEVSLLKRLQGRDNIVRLIDSETPPDTHLLYVVLEYGETDLARLLHRHGKARRERGETGFDENFVRMYWQQMLRAVDEIHRERIVHSDLKPANFLVVEGTLRLIDFGIAKAISSDTTSIAREGQVGTLNYMSPEAIAGGSGTGPGGKPGFKVGRASDIWSLGCILYQMVYGQTPFASLQFVQKIHAITDPRHEIQFPPVEPNAPDVIDVMRRCLDRDPRRRADIPALLEHAFLHPSKSAAGPTGPPAAPGLSAEHLRAMLRQMAAINGREGADVHAMAEVIMGQVARGQPLDLTQFFK